MKLNEISIYFFTAFAIFILISLPALFISQPRMSEPKPDPDLNISDPNIDIAPKEFNTSSINTIVTIFKIVGVLFLLFLLFKLIPLINSDTGSNKKKDKRILKEKEKIDKLKDARTEAYKILREGLISGNYTKAFVKAYQTLDKDLQDFRDMYRPPFWTPKEYAYAVREPVFRPSVFKFVAIFYDLRYGSFDAKRSDLELFILMLDYLFIKDVPLDTLDSLTQEYTKETSNLKLRSIPRRGDPTKPRRK